MKLLIMSLISLLATFQAVAQNNSQITTEPNVEIILPILFISFLIFMIVSLVKYFFDYRLKNKVIDKGMTEQYSAYLFNNNGKDKQNEAIKLAILFCSIGLGLLLTYFSAPIDIHSLAIMALSLGLSYFAYFLYLRKNNK